MKITRDFSEFEPWSDAIPVWNRIDDEGKLNTLEAILEDSYDGAISEEELNDLLRFESDTVYGWLGMRTYKEICDELEEAKDRVQELEDEIEETLAEQSGLDDEDREEFARLEGVLGELREEYEEAMEEAHDLQEEKDNYNF